MSRRKCSLPIRSIYLFQGPFLFPIPRTRSFTYGQIPLPTHLPIPRTIKKGGPEGTMRTTQSHRLYVPKVPGITALQTAIVNTRTPSKPGRTILTWKGWFDPFPHREPWSCWILTNHDTTVINRCYFLVDETQTLFAYMAPSTIAGRRVPAHWGAHHRPVDIPNMYCVTTLITKVRTIRMLDIYGGLHHDMAISYNEGKIWRSESDPPYTAYNKTLKRPLTLEETALFTRLDPEPYYPSCIPWSVLCYQRFEPEPRPLKLVLYKPQGKV